MTDSEGQVTTKVSPQVVGSRGTFWGSDGAAIWEEDPKSGQYQMQYLNQLLPPDSGWDLQYANDINDDGLIAAEGWYQPKDQDGNPAGDPQWKACLLWPMKTAYVFLGTASTSGPQFAGDRNIVFNTLVEYLNTVPYQADQTVLDYLRTFDGPHQGATCMFAKGAKPNSDPVRVFIYNCVTATGAPAQVAKEAMKEALSVPGAYVTFNGHANTGAGPAFSLDVGGLSGFMHVSNGVSAISPSLFTAYDGYNFALQPYTPGDPTNEILAHGTNYTVPILHIPRFPSAPLQDSFEVIGFGSAAYHYWSDVKDEPDQPSDFRPFTLVKTSGSDRPTLRYRWFFFDACNSGRDYIEVFDHGTFFYTRNFSGATETTREFVKGVVEGQTAFEVTAHMNNYYEDDPQTNVFHRFSP